MIDCEWLPELYKAPSTSDPLLMEIYEDELFDLFSEVYKKHIIFKKLVVRPSESDTTDGKSEMFWHIVSGKNKYEIIPDRTQRIAWSKHIIENYICNKNCCETKPLYWVKLDNRRIHRHKFF